MKRLFKGMVLISACLGASAPAWAQNDPRVPVTFNQQVPNDNCTAVFPAPCSGGQVSQSRTFRGQTFTSQVTYKFTIDNNTTNDLNRVFARLAVMNVGGSTAASIDDVVASVPLAPDACTYSASRSSVRCELGDGFAPTATPIAVYFIVNVPQDGLQILADWQGGGFEGNGNGNGCCQPAGQYYTTMVDKTVDQSYKFTLQTFVKKEGTQLFTGDGYIPMGPTKSGAGDLNTTFVGLPKIADTYGANAAAIANFIGNILESTPTDCTSARFKQSNCYRSEINIPAVDFSKYFVVGNADPQYWTHVAVDADLGQAVDTTNPIPDELLDIVLRVDSSAIKGNPAATDFVVTYDGVPVGSCAGKTIYLNTGKLLRPDLSENAKLLATADLPCWTSKTYFSGNVGDLRGDLEVRGKHFKNGGWTIQ